MNTYIGIDLGTSAVKLLLVSKDGKVLNKITEECAISYPQSGWSEQNPEEWYAKTISGLVRLLDGCDKSKIRGIGIGGQMHGLVILDGEDKVIRPAILWNDGRAQKQTDYLNNVIGTQKLSDCTANIAFSGFTAPKILWVKENEPQNFGKIDKIMLPKDYLTFKLSGKHCTDYSDASGTLLLDVQNKCWSGEMCEICGVKAKWLPRLYESYQQAGCLKSDIADMLGLSHNVVIAAGAGDNAAAAVGTGTLDDGECNISVGTSGTVFIPCQNFTAHKNKSLHSFCHSNGKYHLMGCILSAALCNKWWMDGILQTDKYGEEQQGIENLLGKNKVFFLPYLMGERCPHNDVAARGAFIGMRPDTTRKDMTLAVLEGVAFALKDCLTAATADGIKISSATVCGGGARSPIWKQIITDILDVPVYSLHTEEGPAYGGAMLAMAACGEYVSLSEAAEKFVKKERKLMPNREAAALYAEKYEIYKKLYPALKQVFKEF